MSDTKKFFLKVTLPITVVTAVIITMVHMYFGWAAPVISIVSNYLFLIFGQIFVFNMYAANANR